MITAALRTFILVALGAAAACGGNSQSPPTPTGPSTTTGTIAQSPTGTGIAGVTTFAFTAVNFIANTGGTLTYTWDFGDGTAGLDLGTAVTHTYQTPGTFVVKLSVANSKDITAVSALLSGLQVVSLSGSWGMHDSTGALVVNRGMSFFCRAGQHSEATSRPSLVV
jgi:PKD repeat protein